eukprot:TCONS_00038306-protein
MSSPSQRTVIKTLSDKRVEEIYLIITLSLRTSLLQPSTVTAQGVLACNMTPLTANENTRPRHLKEIFLFVKIGSNSLNFFHAYLTREVMASKQPPLFSIISPR